MLLTSSRADYGIYTPLIRALEKDAEINLKIVVFGTHLSRIHGYTISQIEADGFRVFKKIETLLIGDSPMAISTSYALTSMKFSEFWDQYQNQIDIAFALGDRFEMAAAVAASIPFQIRIAHIHGGETTLGAIDNIYRHSISLSSSLHFVSTQAYKKRLIEVLGNENAKIFNVGSLSLENLEIDGLFSIQEMYDRWGIDLHHDTILVTVHPETVSYKQNEDNCRELCFAIEYLAKKFQIVITMPNADTSGMLYRDAFLKLSDLKFWN